MQGQVNTPTGCVNGDQIPIQSDKCFNNVVENRSPQVYQQLDKNTGLLPKELPKTGNFNIILPILFTIIVVGVYLYVKRINTR